MKSLRKLKKSRMKFWNGFWSKLPSKINTLQEMKIMSSYNDLEYDLHEYMKCDKPSKLLRKISRIGGTHHTCISYYIYKQYLKVLKKQGVTQTDELYEEFEVLRDSYLRSLEKFKATGVDCF